MRLRAEGRTWEVCPLVATTSSGPSCGGYPNGNSGTCIPYTTRCHVPLTVLSFRLSSTRATLIALFCTFSSAFDVPVYWPILVMYFLVLFVLTMRRQIQ